MRNRNLSYVGNNDVLTLSGMSDVRFWSVAATELSPVDSITKTQIEPLQRGAAMQWSPSLNGCISLAAIIPNAVSASLVSWRARLKWRHYDRTKFTFSLNLIFEPKALVVKVAGS